MDATAEISTASLLLIVAMLAQLRFRSNGFEVNPPDPVIAVVQAVDILLSTCQLQNTKIGEGEIHGETAFAKTSTSAIRFGGVRFASGASSLLKEAAHSK